MRIIRILAAGAATIAIAAPAAAQYYPAPQQTYPQYQYPQQAQPQYQYAQPGYGGQNVVGQIINQLLGNRYQSNDRMAVTQCATAAMTRASAQYRPRHVQHQGYGYGHPGYGHPGYNQGYNPAMRVTSITDVRRDNRGGLRVSGLMSSGMHAGQPPYGQAYGYHNQGPGQHGYANQHHAVASDLTFRCTVARNGQVTSVRVGRNTQGYRR
jgi:hypothetical protein